MSFQGRKYCAFATS